MEKFIYTANACYMYLEAEHQKIAYSVLYEKPSCQAGKASDHPRGVTCNYSLDEFKSLPVLIFFHAHLFTLLGNLSLSNYYQGNNHLEPVSMSFGLGVDG